MNILDIPWPLSGPFRKTTFENSLRSRDDVSSEGVRGYALVVVIAVSSRYRIDNRSRNE